MSKKILVVDDEPDVLKFVMFRLKKKGFDILAALDGREALNMIQEKPDLALLDVRLPFINGLEVCKTIKGNRELKQIPIILMTASTQNIADKVTECGADDYIIKPFETEELLSKVNKFLGENIL